MATLSVAYLSGLKRPQLFALCKDRDIKCRGTNNDLIVELLSYVNRSGENIDDAENQSSHANRKKELPATKLLSPKIGGSSTKKPKGKGSARKSLDADQHKSTSGTSGTKKKRASLGSDRRKSLSSSNSKLNSNSKSNSKKVVKTKTFDISVTGSGITPRNRAYPYASGITAERGSELRAHPARTPLVNLFPAHATTSSVSPANTSISRNSQDASVEKSFQSCASSRKQESATHPASVDKLYQDSPNCSLGSQSDFSNNSLNITRELSFHTSSPGSTRPSLAASSPNPLIDELNISLMSTNSTSSSERTPGASRRHSSILLNATPMAASPPVSGIQSFAPHSSSSGGKRNKNRGSSGGKGKRKKSLGGGRTARGGTNSNNATSLAGSHSKSKNTPKAQSTITTKNTNTSAGMNMNSKCEHKLSGKKNNNNNNIAKLHIDVSRVSNDTSPKLYTHRDTNKKVENAVQEVCLDEVRVETTTAGRQRPLTASTSRPKVSRVTLDIRTPTSCSPPTTDTEGRWAMARPSTAKKVHQSGGGSAIKMLQSSDHKMYHSIRRRTPRSRKQATPFTARSVNETIESVAPSDVESDASMSPSMCDANDIREEQLLILEDKFNELNAEWEKQKKRPSKRKAIRSQYVYALESTRNNTTGGSSLTARSAWQSCKGDQEVTIEAKNMMLDKGLEKRRKM